MKTTGRKNNAKMQKIENLNSVMMHTNSKQKMQEIGGTEDES